MLPLNDLETGGLNAPRVQVDLFDPSFKIDTGAAIYESELPRGTKLECLAVLGQPGPLVVSFHGALLRKKYQLPRFERLNSLTHLGVNALFFSDPALYLSRRLELAWYTGWAGLELHEIIAEWINKVRQGIGAPTTLLTGSSGGGFAALQTAPFVPDSIAVVFNPQTQLDKYLVGGRVDGTKAQRDYLRFLYPELLEPNSEVPENWGHLVGPKASVLERYKVGPKQKVYYWSNPDDFHHESHFQPLLKFSEEHPNAIDLHSKIYKSRPGHRPPPPAIFTEAIQMALADS